MLDATPPPLPNYERPPVVETVLGVQFERLHRLTNAHLGAFWRTLDLAEWSNASDVPTIEPQFERFGESANWSKGIQIKLSQDCASRLQIRNNAGDRMIQIQNGRLHFNWLGKTVSNYPRYSKVRQGFDEVWRKFRGFVDAEKLGELRTNQWEVTYLNQIPRDTVWGKPSDWIFFRPLVVPDVDIVCGESFSGEWHFVIPPEKGRLHVQWRHGRNDQDEREMVVLTLTARGPINESQPLDAGLNLGHEVIVRSFASLVSDKANDYWGLNNANR